MHKYEIKEEYCFLCDKPLDPHRIFKYFKRYQEADKPVELCRKCYYNYISVELWDNEIKKIKEKLNTGNNQKTQA
jgi:hypothetical protein